jgi:F-type H+-transporting ATPase subunit beta
MSQGTIVQCIGAVVDVQFPRDKMPRVYDALVLEQDATNTLVEQGLTFEVEQQLGDGIVRTIAMGSSDGLKRGMKVKNTGENIQVPVGHGVLGRVMDVLGRPIDERGPVKADKRRGIHQPAPKFEELRRRPSPRPASRSSTWSARSRRAARSACSAARCRQTVNMLELINNIESARGLSVFAGVGERTREQRFLPR